MLTRCEEWGGGASTSGGGDGRRLCRGRADLKGLLGEIVASLILWSMKQNIFTVYLSMTGLECLPVQLRVPP